MRGFRNFRTVNSIIVRSAFILSSLLLLCCQSATCQRLLHLKTGTFPLLTQDFNPRNTEATQYLFYETDHILSDGEKETLSKSGMDILYALKGNVYWVRTRQNQDDQISRNLYDLNPNYKLGYLSEDRSSIQKLRISIAPGLVPSEILKWADLNDITLLDIRAIAFGLIDVEIKSSSFETILNTPWISFIDIIPRDEEVNYRWLNGERGWGLKSPLTRNLDGSGMTIGIGDGGRLGTHDDISDSVLDLASFGISNHPTQVTGIVAGSGLLDPAFGFGYAPNANVIVRNFSDILWDTPQYIEDFNLALTNNSYSANPNDCAYIGDYNGTSTGLDAMADSFPQLLHVFAAGNSGGMVCSPYPIQFATIAGGYQSAKNVLTVGSVGPTDGNSSFSSRGPVDDGRLKPEVVAYGAGRVSTINNNNYASSSGTSFSSPATMGMATLLYERYRELHGDSMPDAALIKNLICNGADDLGVAGPDFIYGFGRINGVRSVEMLESNHYDSVTVDHNSNIFKTFIVPFGTATIDVMLMWSDHPSAPYETVSLVNDLDLILIDPSGDTIKPWKLNYTPSGVTIAATTGSDHTNNFEQVTVSTVEQGAYTIIVKGYHVPMGPQTAWLSWDLQMNGITVQSPIGGEVFKPSASDLQYIRWDAFGTGNSLFNIDYSTNGGQSWSVVAGNVPAKRRYQSWFIPNTSTDSLRVRVTASNGMSDTSASNAVIMAPPANLNISSPCDGYIQASWNAVTGADYYMIYSLKNELLTVLDTTSNLSIIIGGFASGESQRITVAGVFPSGKPGLRTRAILITANGGDSCAWNHDLRIDSLNNPISGRQSTSSSLTSTETVEILLTNSGLLTASGFSLSYQVDNSAVVTESFPGNLNPGTSQSFSFSQTADLSATEDYNVMAWITYPSDPFHQNDTTTTTIVHLQNPLLSLPWNEGFELIPDTQFISSSIGLANLNAWDVILQDTARIRTFAGTPFHHTGERALTMDAVRNVSAESGEVLVTLNLFKYNVQDDDIRLSLHYMHHEIIPDAVNTESIHVRGSDTDSFLLLATLPNEAIQRGVWQHLAGLEISELLMNANQDFSTSFQIKFPFIVNATAGQINSQDGQTIDDIGLQLIEGDLKMNSLLHPSPISCGLGMESIEVSITNTGEVIIADPVISYQLNNGPIQSTPVDDIPPDTTMNFTLSPIADFSTTGTYDLLVWIRCAADAFHLNDTIHTEILHTPMISVYPYREGFETNSAGYFAGGINSTWSYGSPGKEIISRAAEGQKVWTTALSGSHNADEESYLYSPCFDLDGLTQPFLSFAFQYQLETGYDYAWVEYRLADSNNWIKLGTQGSGTNWYNHSSHRWNGTQSKWITTGIAIPFTDTTIQFRWVMMSDVGVELEGIAIDQVHVYDQVSIYTGAPLQWTLPVSGNNWIHIDQGGQRVFGIHPQGQDLGNVTLNLFKSNQNFIAADSFYLLSRSWLITGTNSFTNNIKLRAYYTVAEANNLVAATGCAQCIKSRDGLDVAALRYSGINEDGLYNNNITGGVTTLTNDSTDVYPYENGYYAEWTTDSLSEWWISTPVTKKSGTLIRSVSSSGDDAEEHENNGSVNPVREILSMTDYEGHQKIGWRFKNITIPSGSYISSATVNWTSSETTSGPASWLLQSEMSADANSFTTHKYNISLRPRSDQVVQWAPGGWSVDEEYSTPDIRHLIQKVIDQPIWINGNDLVLVMKGDGLRESWSYDGDPSKSAELIISYQSICSETGILYVDKNASGLQNGSSWTNAYRSLEQSLDRATHCPGTNQIWVADGTYTPYAEVPRITTFGIPPGISVYGGFQGTETSINQRIPGSFPTILNGDIGISGNLSDNLYHVVSILPGTGNVILDGLIIEKGMANGPMPSEQTGSGIYNQGSLSGNQLILQFNSYPSVYNAPASVLISTGIVEIRQ